MTGKLNTCGAKGGRTRGFTLIELLVVLVIISLMVGLAMPLAYKAVPGLELRAAAERLASDLRLARARAVTLGTDQVVELDIGRNAYEGTQLAPVYIPKLIQVQLTAARIEQLDDARAGIRFFPDGTSTGGRITLSRNEQEYGISVDWFNGQVATENVRR